MNAAFIYLFLFWGGGLYGPSDIFVSWQWLGLDKESKKLVVDTTANQVKIINMQIGKLSSNDYLYFQVLFN